VASVHAVHDETPVQDVIEGEVCSRRQYDEKLLDHEYWERIGIYRYGYAHKETDGHDCAPVSTLEREKTGGLQVEAIGRQSPHHALFMNKRVKRQRLAMK